MGSEKLLPFLKTWAPELSKREFDWAVGGALAMQVHGYQRETRDIDLFFAPEQREAVLSFFDERGIETHEVHGPFHYAISPFPAEPDLRFDLLFPYDRPDITAVAFPTHAEVSGVTVPVWRIEHIVAAKLTSMGRPKDEHDVRALWDLRLFEPEQVREVLREIGRKDAVDRLSEVIAPRATKPRLKRIPPKKR